MSLSGSLYAEAKRLAGGRLESTPMSNVQGLDNFILSSKLLWFYVTPYFCCMLMNIT